MMILIQNLKNKIIRILLSKHFINIVLISCLCNAIWYIYFLTQGTSEVNYLYLIIKIILASATTALLALLFAMIHYKLLYVFLIFNIILSIANVFLTLEFKLIVNTQMIEFIYQTNYNEAIEVMTHYLTPYRLFLILCAFMALFLWIQIPVDKLFVKIKSNYGLILLGIIAFLSTVDFINIKNSINTLVVTSKAVKDYNHESDVSSIHQEYNKILANLPKQEEVLILIQLLLLSVKV